MAVVIFAWVWVKEGDWDRIRDLLRNDPGVVEVDYQERQEVD